MPGRRVRLGTVVDLLLDLAQQVSRSSSRVSALSRSAAPGHTRDLRCRR